MTFPVYLPTATAGFTRTLDGPLPCGYGGVEVMTAWYAKGRASIGLAEDVCGNAGESTTVTSADINGVQVRIDVFCYSPGPKCTVADGFENGFLLYVTPPGSKRLPIQVESSRLSLETLLTFVRSLARVTPARPTVTGGAFRSPTGNLSCAMGGSLVYCQSKQAPHTVTMGDDGKFTPCDGKGCARSGRRVSSWPTLAYGKRVDVGPFRCVSETTGISCMASRSGKGFSISSAGVAPVTRTRSRSCSKTEATAVVKELELGETSFIPDPVYKVLCGAFMGPGSDVMVVSLASGGTSVPFEGWVVFRRTGSTWQLVMQQRNGADISTAGTGIRETRYISRPGDPRCCPTGGRKERIWRWDRTKFVTTPWKQVTP